MCLCASELPSVIFLLHFHLICKRKKQSVVHLCVSNAVNMGQNLGLKARDLTPCGLNVCGRACSHIFCSIHSIESFLSPETMLTKHSDGFLQLPMTFSDSFCLTLTSAMCTLFSFAIIRYSLIITFRRNNVVMVKK